MLTGSDMKVYLSRRFVMKTWEVVAGSNLEIEAVNLGRIIG